MENKAAYIKNLVHKYSTVMSQHRWYHGIAQGKATIKKFNFLKCLGLFARHGRQNVKMAPAFLPLDINALHNLPSLSVVKTYKYNVILVPDMTNHHLT